MTTQPRLRRLKEAPELFLDSYIADGDSAVFLSLWGRDTAIHELMAKLTLPIGEGGFDSLTLMGEQPVRLHLNRDRLGRRTTRTYRQTRFGSLLNLWLFDQRCHEPDRANRQCYAIFNERDPRQDKSAMLWSRLRDLAAYPLLDHWRPTVVQLLLKHGAIRMLDRTSERLSGVWIDLSLASVQEAIGHRIRSGELTIQ
ncbi:hypothetical protein MHM84_18750 [Halomonas sp. McH1-25]|uniref:hypothetical protein n=1 Tax=unclassified Halomonas TaxID=2609666 RepID=UPI001EF6C562|nr:MULTISPECIES: hypothetical protein [unclassified Halomonas]MCG7601807.1 hypothetical protein [Halomonas sp. McH1-25]MCP1343983.1 hypothetical protein [Halomonas sp. FL8]MCP1361784.1 hypothetical protein [Halomonas sp. BBD45]MCP1364564.1 hypothetical protein [Halomonas sp. BBD48]